MSGLRIDAIRRTARDPGALAGFYRRALGFEEVARPSPGLVRLRLGEEHLELAPTARPAPAPAPSNSTAFQHVAIIVSDMDAAMLRLAAEPGWAPISVAGPERLPAASGGVKAFKFRDPEGHPAELLQFPDAGVPPVWQARRGLFLGLDHSAITVSDTARSIGFYERLGFAVVSRQVNRGIEQARMDGVDGAVVEVTGLAPPGAATPHLELLCYLEPGTTSAPASGGSAFVFAGVPAGTIPRADPDGHRLLTA